jgi:Tfp pilus assembly protein PilO
MTSKNAMKLTFKLFLFLLAGGIVFATTGCKNKKKLAQEAAAKEYAAKVEKARAELQAILDDDGTMPLAEMERRLNDIKGQNLNDPEVNILITKVEDKIAKEKARIKKLEDEKKLEKEKKKEVPEYQYINDYFHQIANAKDVVTANTKIAEALKLYAGKNVPVLIIISQADGITDYDKPTTIDAYLNFVKDQKRYSNDIYNVKFDEYGQITELELIKK